MPGVVQVPVVVDDPILGRHLGEKRGTGIWGEDMKGCGGDTAVDGPVDSAREYIAIITVQAKDKTAVDHDPKTVEAAHHFAVIAAEVLAFARSGETIRRKCFKADKEAAQTC